MNELHELILPFSDIGRKLT